MPGPGADCFGDEERKEVMDVLSSGHLSRYGDLADHSFKHKVYSFEQEFAEQLGAKHALATNSGTASLYIALLALGLGAGDEVLVPGYTYVASISSIIYTQATPVLVEIDESLNIDPIDIEKKITNKTKAIMVVHMLGNPCDMDAIMEIARRHKLYVIEDTCQAIGASYRGKSLGTFGNVGVFSLNRYKMIAGEGGVITTDDSGLYRRAFAIHDQGHRPNRSSKDAAGTLVGLNLKMNELTGAVALAQTRKLDWMLRTLREKKTKIKAELAELDGIRFRRINDAEGECATVLTVVFEDEERARNVAQRLNTKTMIESGWHVYANMQQIYNSRTPVENWKGVARFAAPGSLPRTDDILSRSVSISIGVVDGGLGTGFGVNINATPDELTTVIHSFKEAFQG